MRSSRPTSARRGTLSRIKVSSVRRLAIISGSVAFLAPDIGIVPWSGRPPTIRMRSIFSAPAAFSRPTRSAAYLPARIAAKVGNGSDIGIGRRHILGLAAARLLLAALEVFPQRRRQPRAARRPFLGFAGFDHGQSQSMPPAAPQPRAGLARLRGLTPYGNDRGVFRQYISGGRCRSSVVEHPLGKGEVVSSILTGSTRSRSGFNRSTR